jgi:hypothetical protein
MATPHVAGAWAILRQAAPQLSVESAIEALRATGLPVADVHAQTSRIRVLSALLEVLPACSNSLDDDGDGLADFPADPGCSNDADPTELSAALPCDDGVDNDDDGSTDYPGDRGCGSSVAGREDPACDDGLDNDGDGGADWDGDPGDAQCIAASRDTEAVKRGCGVGFELLLLALPFARLRRYRPLDRPNHQATRPCPDSLDT